MARRVRSPMVRGFGVGDRQNAEEEQRVQTALQWRKQQHLRINNNKHRWPNANKSAKTAPAHSFSNTHKKNSNPDQNSAPYLMDPHSHHHQQQTMPYFLAATLVTFLLVGGAILLHFIHMGAHHQKTKKKQQLLLVSRRKRKQKIDELNEDADVLLLPSTSIRSTDTTPAPPLLPPLLPPQILPLQQQQSSSSILQQQQQQQAVQQQQPSSSTYYNRVVPYEHPSYRHRKSSREVTAAAVTTTVTPPQQQPQRNNSYYLPSSGTSPVVPRHSRYGPPPASGEGVVPYYAGALPLSTTLSSFESITEPLPKSSGSSTASTIEYDCLLGPQRNKRMDDQTPLIGNRTRWMDNENASFHQAPIVPPLQQQPSFDQFQLMETGNLSWCSSTPNIASGQNTPHNHDPHNMRDSVLAAAAAASMNCTSDDDASYPSNDPRRSIFHKRHDLTQSTDATSSLGTIEFSELHLLHVIGGGGFGQVWKATWRGTPVAVKLLTGAAQSPKVPRAVLEEFAAEINLLQGMRHPNICLYMGASLTPPHRAIITELAAHGSVWDALRLPLSPPYETATTQWPERLYQPDAKYGAPPVARMKSLVIPAGTWPFPLVWRVACGAARGMAYLHSGQPPVLHRDLKSANLLLDESYTPKVCDFGLSRLQASSMTGNCGTVQWMAPEVLANQSYNEKADVYSYGIILWELLTRQCPYDKMSPIQCALAVLQRNQRPEIPQWCPPCLHALIRKCVKKDPTERPTFQQILHTLDTLMPTPPGA